MNNARPNAFAQNISTQFFIGQKKVIEIILCLITLLSSPLVASEELSEIQNISSSPSMINRAPLVSSRFEPSNLDRISTNISNITKSLNNILTESAEEEEEEITTEVEIIEEPVQQQAQPLIDKPESITPENIEVAKPVIVAKPMIKEEKPLAAKEASADILPSLPSKPVVNASLKQAETITKEDISNVMHQTKYLKKGHDGKILPDNTAIWSCIEDMNNGLIWEVKSEDGSIHDKNNSYSWFKPDATETPQGVADGGQCKGDSDCDTHAYVELINKQKYCGYSDWRLPTKDEMLSIVSFENKTSTTINSDYFPGALPSWYWTASSNEKQTEYAWYILFRNGIALNDLKERPKHIRLVRSQTEKG